MQEREFSERSLFGKLDDRERNLGLVTFHSNIFFSLVALALVVNLIFLREGAIAESAEKRMLMIKYLLLMIAVCVFSEEDSYAKSRGSVFLYATQSTLSGEPSSESSRNLSFFSGGISFREKTGFGVGWYYSTQYNSVKVTKAGFDVATDKDANFDSIAIGV